jgi:EamA-like transporter family
VSPAEVVLLAANAVYGTSYVAMRLAVDDVGPVTLAFLRLALACAILIPIGFGLRKAGPGPSSAGDRRTFFWMGFIGFTLALAFSHWGLLWSTATNGCHTPPSETSLGVWGQQSSLYRFGATRGPRPASWLPRSRRRRASAKTASNIGHVSRPVCVFWRLGW